MVLKNRTTLYLEQTMKAYAFFCINGVYLLFTVPLFFLIFGFFRYILKEKDWYKTDSFFSLGGIIYWAIYLLNKKLHFSVSGGKGLSNILSEIFWIAISYSLLLLGRSILGKVFPNGAKIASLLLIPLLVVTIILFFCLTPIVPE